MATAMVTVRYFSHTAFDVWIALAVSGIIADRVRDDLQRIMK